MLHRGCITSQFQFARFSSGLTEIRMLLGLDVTIADFDGCSKEPIVSEKRIAANRRNAMRSTGPTSIIGKQRARANSSKHSILTRELVIDEKEKVDFDALRNTLYSQLSPASALQQIAFDRIVNCCWRLKLAIRLRPNGCKLSLPNRMPTLKSTCRAKTLFFPSGLQLATQICERLFTFSKICAKTLKLTAGCTPRSGENR